jgi:hypothetical protein
VIQAQVTQLTVNKTYVDLPNVREVFADHVRLVMVADGVAHVELCSTHIDDAPVAGVLTGKLYPTVRFAMPLPVAAMLTNLLSQQMAPLQVVMPPQPATTPPKH